MNKTLTLAAFVLVAVVMGMSSVAPAIAPGGGPPEGTPPGQNSAPPDCDDLIALLDDLDVAQAAKDAILIASGCDP